LVNKVLAFAAIFGAVCLILGMIMVNDTLVLLRGSQETTATVVDYYNPQYKVYYPIFKFKDITGSTITAQSIEPSIEREFKIGQSVQILYNPINPTENVRINTLTNIWLGPILLTIGGTFNLALSLGLIWRKLKADDCTTLRALLGG
jgi:hypothetical protein